MMCGLRWNLFRRYDGHEDDYATDANDKPLFLIERTATDGWVLYQSKILDVEPINRERVDWFPVWSFDSQEQARNEAEIRYRDGAAGGVRTTGVRTAAYLIPDS